MKRLIMLAVLGLLSCRTTTPATDSTARLDALERKLAKLTAALDNALGPADPDPAATYAMPVSDLDPVEGKADALVTIVEGFEYLCPYCAKANRTMEAVAAKYPNDVRIAYKYLVIHGAEAAMPGVVHCAAAKQGKGREMRKALWAALAQWEGEQLKGLDRDAVAAEAVGKLSQQVGLSEATLGPDMQACRQWLSQSTEALHALGVSGTPAFFINGRYVSGARPQADFEALIEEELAKAKQRVAAGARPATYYHTEIVEKGLRKVKGRFDD